MGFGNYLNVYLLQEIIALPCGPCTVVLQPCPDSSARLHILLWYYQVPPYCQGSAAPEVLWPKE